MKRFWKPIAHIIFGALILISVVLYSQKSNASYIVSGIALTFLVVMLIVEQVMKIKGG